MEAAWDMAARLRADPPLLESSNPIEPPEPMDWPSRRGVLGGLLAASAVAGGATAYWRYIWDVELYRTQVGERRVIALKDGSHVHLNTGSTIEVALKKDRRLVRLVKGEAMFEVAHDRQRPFLVDAGSAQMRAVGTAFNVRIRENIVELTVTEGSVAVADQQVRTNTGCRYSTDRRGHC